MAIESSKLNAFANPKTAEAAPMDDEDVPDMPAVGQEEEDDFQEHGDGKYGEFIPMLEKHAKALEEACDNLDPETLQNPEMELGEIDKTIVMDAWADMDPEFQTALIDTLMGDTMPWEDAKQLAEALYTEDMIEDPDVVGGMLFRMAAIAKDAEAVEGESEEGDEDAEPIEAADENPLEND